MRVLVALGIVGALLLAGCGEKKAEAAPLGNAAPEFGKAPEHASLQAFMVGKWCVVASMAGPDPTRYYEFKADGTFTCGDSDGDWDAAGKWSATGELASLTYETMKGKPWLQFQEEYKKDEQEGGQVSVARAVFYDDLYGELQEMTAVRVSEDDPRQLTFGAPPPPPGQGDEEDVGSIFRGVDYDLQRMGSKK
jgi:hypothetical protein